MTAPRPFLVKICGVTSAEDARVASAEGADAIGVNLWPGSKRYVDDAAARAVLAAVPSHVLKVGVFVNPTPAEVEARMAALGLDRAQLHGDERSDTFAAMDGERIIRVIRVQDGSSFAAATSWKSALFLYDAFVEGYGGAGVPPPWPLVARLARRPFLLAGGLTPRNVELAIATVRPNGVDVASGVERFTRQKDPQLLAAFIAAARGAARKL